MRTTSILSLGLCAAALVHTFDASGVDDGGAANGPFRRVSSFPVHLNSSIEEETVCEIITASKDGELLIYTDGVAERVGFVDIADPLRPQPGGVLEVGGEPTSVAVAGGFALAAVNTSPDYVNPSGELVVIDLASRSIARRIDLGGQPDSVAVSPDGRFAAIAIENERDEDHRGGELPQLPAGWLSIVDLEGAVADWTVRRVELTGLAEVAPGDPEPEFVDINVENEVVISLQENNHLVVVRLEDGEVLHHFSAGAVDLVQIDTRENDLIELDGHLVQVPREPDAVAWASPETFFTADEGDWKGGSRGFTGFHERGFPIYQPGREVEHHATRLGHFPEHRAGSKGAEPEALEYGDYGDLGRFLFVGCERASLVLVYELPGDDWVGSALPRYAQSLPTGVGPEGLLAIPQRGLFVSASEEDARDAHHRSTVTIYSTAGPANYPTVVSALRADGTPIPWGALSGLAAGTGQRAYAVHDDEYRASRIYTLDTGRVPALIDGELVVRDDDDVLRRALESLREDLADRGEFKPGRLLGKRGTVHLDLEGVAAVEDGFWLVSEGVGQLTNGISPEGPDAFRSPNIALRVDAAGKVQRAILLRSELAAKQSEGGFEGVAVDGDHLYVAFQNAWAAAGDPSGRARIGRIPLEGQGGWQFAYYPLDADTGVSELTALGEGRFAVLERDSRSGTEARIKRLYRFDAAELDWRSDAQVSKIDVIEKRLLRDLLAEGDFAVTGGAVPAKLEGLCVLENGDYLLVNDNDGADANSGETQLLRLGPLGREQ